MSERKKRVYGYLETEKETPEEKTDFSPRRTNNPKNGRPLWLVLCFLPFKLLFLLLQGFKKGLQSLFGVYHRLPKQTRHSLSKKIFHFALICGVLGFVGLIGLFAWASYELPDPNRLSDRDVAQSTKIYDRTGNVLLYEIFADQKRTIVPLNEIPADLIHGAIATEDTKFYEHHGVRPLSILRAFVYGFANKRIAGTSTLTQQLVKNAILTNERTLGRKVKELVLSIRLEQKFTKDEILQIYFNEIPYGSTNYGIEAASQSYFSKSAKDLTLAESATLAGLPKAPTVYLNNPEALKERRNFVLRRMFEEGYINEEQKLAAQATELKLNERYTNIHAPHFVKYVQEQLVNLYGEKMVGTGGLKVVTSLDWKMQELAEKSLKNNEKVLQDAGAETAALLALDPKSGNILAMVGSLDYHNPDIKGNFNATTQARREPGSSIKPIIYAAAFEKGYTPETILFDVLTNFALSGNAYTPKNYDLEERGPVTMRQALQGSLNIPAVQTFYLVGEKKGVAFAEKLGYSTFNTGNFGLALVLGGGGVSMLEHVGAYGVFANNGLRHPAVSILKVESPNHDVLYEWKEDKGEQVLDAKVAATITNVLSDDAARQYVFGAGSVLALKDRPVAAKTGTTQDYRDAWIVGYTPILVSGVWAGNNDYGKPMKPGFGGSKVAGQIWNEFMTEALKGTPVESFPTPPTNDAEKAILRGSVGGGITLTIDKVTGKLATSSTPEKYITVRTYVPPHSILQYVDKDNPRGPVPEHPENDSQYQNWENAIQDWIKRRKEKEPNWEVSFEEPPSEYDDAHTLELIPNVTLVYPAPSSTLFNRQIDTDIRVSAPRGVAKVTWQIDGNFVSVVREHPFNLNYYARDINNGNHILTAIVEDDVGNRVEESINFTLSAGEEPPGVTWIGGDRTVRQQEFPLNLLLRPFKGDQIEKIIISAGRSGGTLSFVGEITAISGTEPVSFTWRDTPSSGLWTLLAEVKLKNQETKVSDTTTITVQ